MKDRFLYCRSVPEPSLVFLMRQPFRYKGNKLCPVTSY